MSELCTTDNDVHHHLPRMSTTGINQPSLHIWWFDSYVLTLLKTIQRFKNLMGSCSYDLSPGRTDESYRGASPALQKSKSRLGKVPSPRLNSVGARRFERIQINPPHRLQTNVPLLSVTTTPQTINLALKSTTRINGGISCDITSVRSAGDTVIADSSKYYITWSWDWIGTSLTCIRERRLTVIKHMKSSTMIVTLPPEITSCGWS